jgi:hypothetical protein
MDQGTSLVPNRSTFDRFTANAIWYPGVDAGGFDLGVIDLHTLDEGISREKVMINLEGNVELGYDEIISVAPVWQLKGKQFHSLILPLLFMGTRGADVTQTASSGVDRTVIAALGQTFDFGARSVGNSVVTVPVSGYTAIPDVDYFIDESRGTIRFPIDAAGIAEGDEVNIHFQRRLLTREVYIAFNQLNQPGNLQLFLMDSHFAEPVEEIFMPGSISRDKGSDGDPVKTDQWALRFACEGQPTILRLARWDEFLLDDDSVLEYA